MKTAILYALITVTYGGTVGHSEGYSSLAFCREAQSVALVGKTTKQLADERAAKDLETKKHREASEKKAADWLRDHPPRSPPKLDFTLCRFDFDASKPDTLVFYSEESPCVIKSDGLAYDLDPSLLLTTGSGYLVTSDNNYWKTTEKYAGSIRHAECVILPPKEKQP